MASDQPAPLKEDPPLSFMEFLSPAVSYFEPTASSSGSGGPPGGHDPELIVMLTWFAARDVHIAKYVVQHRALFPSSRILIVRMPVISLLFPSRATADIKAALPVLRSVAAGPSAAPRGGDSPRILLHVFSNGGVTTAAKLYRMLGGPASVPRHVLLLDSCPGYFHWMRTHLALSQALPRIFSPLVHVFLAVAWLLRAPFGKPSPVDENAGAINAPELAGNEVRRTYLYGTGDEMVDWRDVEDHAARARVKGFVVRLEKFEGGKHVAHVRVDADRYWRTVKDTWEAGTGK